MFRVYAGIRMRSRTDASTQGSSELYDRRTRVRITVVMGNIPRTQYGMSQPFHGLAFGRTTLRRNSGQTYVCHPVCTLYVSYLDIEAEASIAFVSPLLKICLPRHAYSFEFCVPCPESAGMPRVKSRKVSCSHTWEVGYPCSSFALHHDFDPF